MLFRLGSEEPVGGRPSARCQSSGNYGVNICTRYQPNSWIAPREVVRCGASNARYKHREGVLSLRELESCFMHGRANTDFEIQPYASSLESMVRGNTTFRLDDKEPAATTGRYAGSCAPDPLSRGQGLCNALLSSRAAEVPRHRVVLQKSVRTLLACPHPLRRVRYSRIGSRLPAASLSRQA